MSNAIQAGEDYLRNRAVAVLQQQFLDTAELRSHLERTRDQIDGQTALRIRSLLTGLAGELTCSCKLLEERLESCSSDPAHLQRAGTEFQTFWRLFPSDGSECSERLEALLTGYVHYARATSDSIAFLEMFGDEESVSLMKTMVEVADRGIWFLEIYMEGLALHMDTARLPEFTSVMGDRFHLRPVLQRRADERL